MDSESASKPSPLAHAAVPILLLACVVVFGFRLGQGGFGGTEGHRVIPAWEMLETGDFFTQRMFETIYVRKPPGYSWAIAASTALFGPSEWSARLVGAISATGMVLSAYFFGRRWFGDEGGLWAGSAMLLTPLLWKFGRSAEIEPLNNFCTLLAVLLFLDLTLFRASGSVASRWVRSALLVISMLGVGLVKGPAGLPCLLGAWLATGIVERNWKSLFHPWAFGALLVATTALAGFILLMALAIRLTGEMPVTQDKIVGFQWSLYHLPAILAFAPSALLEVAPMGFFLLLAPWSIKHLMPGPARRVSEGLAWTVLLSLTIFSLAGMTNARYGMPATLLLSVLAGALMPVWRSRAESFWMRALISRRGWVALLASLWLVHVFVVESRREAKSGREAGQRLAGLLPAGAEIWSDSLIEARPETLLYALLYARQTSHREGEHLHVKWVKQRDELLQLPPKGAYIILRTDDDERNRFAEANLLRFLERIGSDQVYKFEYDVYRVIDDAPRSMASTGVPNALLH